MKTPNLQGVGAALAKLQHGLEESAQKLLSDISAVETRGQNVFDRARAQLTGAHANLADVSKFIDELESATNGGPTLGDSSQSPVSADPSETAALPKVAGG